MKKRNMIAVSLLCIIVLCVLLFVHWDHYHKINSNQVEKVQFVNGVEQRALSTEDAEMFISLFNSARYAGAGTGEGGTPEVQMFIFYRDGTYLIVSEFSSLGRDFEVSLRNEYGKQKAWYYVNSEELKTFIQEMTEKS